MGAAEPGGGVGAAGAVVDHLLEATPVLLVARKFEIETWPPLYFVLHYCLWLTR